MAIIAVVPTHSSIFLFIKSMDLEEYVFLSMTPKLIQKNKRICICIFRGATGQLVNFSEFSFVEKYLDITTSNICQDVG